MRTAREQADAPAAPPLTGTLRADPADERHSELHIQASVILKLQGRPEGWFDEWLVGSWDDRSTGLLTAVIRGMDWQVDIVDGAVVISAKR